jgi:hypothetical protein
MGQIRHDGSNLITTTVVLKINGLAGCQWLTPVILATWEAEIGKTTVEVSPGKYFLRPPHLQNNQSKMDWSCG